MWYCLPIRKKTAKKKKLHARSGDLFYAMARYFVKLLPAKKPQNSKCQSLYLQLWEKWLENANCS